MPDDTIDNDSESHTESIEEDTYADIMPVEIREVFSHIGSGDTESKFSVLMLLVHSENRLSKETIREELHRDITDIDDVLLDLQQAGMITRKLSLNSEDETVGMYEVSTYGERILNSLYEAIQPDFTAIVKGDDSITDG